MIRIQPLYLPLSAQVAVGTFFMKSPVSEYRQQNMYANRHADRQTDGQTERHGDRQTGVDINTHSDATCRQT